MNLTDAYRLIHEITASNEWDAGIIDEPDQILSDTIRVYALFHPTGASYELSDPAQWPQVRDDALDAYFTEDDDAEDEDTGEIDPGEDIDL